MPECPECDNSTFCYFEPDGTYITELIWKCEKCNCRFTAYTKKILKRR